MALLTYFILGTLLASSVEAQTAVETCVDNAACVAITTAGIGDVCEALTDGSGSECNCDTGYSRVGNNCVENDDDCTGDATACDNPPFDASCTSNVCGCGAGYLKDGTNCKVQPTKPTLTVSDGTSSVTEFISGNSYTLVCESSTPGNIPYDVVFQRDGTPLTDGNLASVTEAANGGDYTCIASYDGVNSDTSDVVTIEIKPAKPELTLEGSSPEDDLSEGGDYTLSCLSENAPVGITYNYIFGSSPTSASLPAVTSANDGSYTCTAEASGVTSDPSDPIVITVGAAGTYCTTDANCVGDVYTGICTDARCECSSGYTAIGTICSPAGLVCSSGSECNGDEFTGTCTDGSCVCSSGFTKSTTGCQAAGLDCSSDSDCSGDGFTGTCTDESCVCSSGYTKSTTGCEVPPTKPTLVVDGGYVANDLSDGATYSLSCSSENAPVTTTYRYYRGNTLLPNGDLGAVSSSVDGTYTCFALSANGGLSEESNALTVAVGAAGTYCASSNDCSGNSYTGTCTANRCLCASGYELSTFLCTASGQSCTNDGECTGTGLEGTCTDGSCDCSTGFAKSSTGCETPPAKPTVSVDGDNEPSDLSSGASYTLVCTSSGAASGTTYTFFEGTNLLRSGSLATVSSDDDGDYTCVAATSTGAESESSDPLTLTIGVSGLRCTADTNCTAGGGFTGTCTIASSRCECSSGYQAAQATCSSAVHAATISMFCILLAFLVSKLL